MADPKNNKKNQPKKKARDEFQEDELFQAPVITREPSSRQAKLNSRVVLRVQASGKPLPQFQWFFNGKKISGANTDRLTLMKVRRQSIGAYHCEARNHVGKTASRAAMLSIFATKVPKLVIGPENSKLEEGKPFTLSVVSPDAAELKEFKIYWMFNGMRIKGAMGLKLDISAAKKKYEGEYKAMIATGSGLETSNVAKLTVKPPRAVAAEAMPVVEEQKTLEDILAEQPTGFLEAPAKAVPSWDEFNFNPDDEGDTPDSELVAPMEGSEQYGNTSPGTPGAPRSPISQLGTQDLIREVAAQGGVSQLMEDLVDPSALISGAESSAFDLSAAEHEDPSSLIEMLASREEAPVPEPLPEPEDEDALIMDWGFSPAVKKNEPELHSMAASLARSQLEPTAAAPAPLPKRSNLTLARKKAFLEGMLKKFQGRGKQAA